MENFNEGIRKRKGTGISQKHNNEDENSFQTREKDKEEEKEEFREIKENKEKGVINNNAGASFYEWWVYLFWTLIKDSWSTFSSFIFSRNKITTNTDSQPKINFTEIERHRLEKFKARVGIPFDKSNIEHEKSIEVLWKISFPDKPLERISSEWKKLGFQGTDPSTDFRGSGIYGLNNLVYFGTNYGKTFQIILNQKVIKKSSELSQYFDDEAENDNNEKTVELQHSFPFAITGLNITMMLFEILGWGMKAKLQKEASPAQTSLIQMILKETKEEDDKEIDNIFQEVYCFVFVLFDHEWKKSKASYMDFPKVIECVKKRTEQFLLTNPSLELLKQQNQKINDLQN